MLRARSDAPRSEEGLRQAICSASTEWPLGKLGVNILILRQTVVEYQICTSRRRVRRPSTSSSGEVNKAPNKGAS